MNNQNKKNLYIQKNPDCKTTRRRAKNCRNKPQIIEEHKIVEVKSQKIKYDKWQIWECNSRINEWVETLKKLYEILLELGYIDGDIGMQRARF